LLFKYDGIENRSGRREVEESQSAKHKRKPKNKQSLEQTLERKAPRKKNFKYQNLPVVFFDVSIETGMGSTRYSLHPRLGMTFPGHCSTKCGCVPAMPN
jgi:hypothetical protein